MPNDNEQGGRGGSGGGFANRLRRLLKIDTESEPAPQKTTSRLYFIQNTATGEVKIGFSENVAGRLSNLQTASAHELVLLASMPGGLPEETAWHERFRRARLRGEWFRPDPELLAAIFEARSGDLRSPRKVAARAQEEKSRSRRMESLRRIYLKEPR